MKPLLRAAYRLDPAMWAEEVLGLDLDPWQVELLLAPGGAQVAVLSARQAGKTTAARGGLVQTGQVRGMEAERAGRATDSALPRNRGPAREQPPCRNPGGGGVGQVVGGWMPVRTPLTPAALPNDRFGPRAVVRQGCWDQSTLAPEARISGASRACCAARWAAISSGVVHQGSAPWSR